MQRDHGTDNEKQQGAQAYPVFLRTTACENSKKKLPNDGNFVFQMLLDSELHVKYELRVASLVSYTVQNRLR